MEQDTQKEEVRHEASSVSKIKIAISTKNAIIAAIVIVVLALGWYFKGVFIAATVNGAPISRLSVMQEAEKQSGKNALDMMIAKKLVADEERKKGITLSEDEINAALKKIQDQVVASGSTLEKALASQGLTKEDLRQSIIEQEKMKKLLGDKGTVTDEEVTQYMKDNKTSIPEGTPAAQVKDFLSQQKLGTAANALVDSLKATASINYYVKY